MINPLILKEERCVPISSKADQVLHDSTKRALEKMLGEYHSRLLCINYVHIAYQKTNY
jgi:hypothetical protein